MPEEQIVLAILVFLVAGAVMGEMARAIPRWWKWFKFSVWKDLNYSQGYKKGYADGQRNERQWRNVS